MVQTSKELWKANGQYGWHVYVGILSNVATSSLSTFMISYFLDNTAVGFFSLAVALTIPLTQVSSVVGTTYFKDFAHLESLPKKVTAVTIALSAITLLAFMLLIKPLVEIVYTGKFLEVVSLAYIVAVGATLDGIGDYFNRFLAAHGKGKSLRNSAIVVGIVNVLGFTGLVKVLGTEGAALTRLFSGIVYSIMMISYYISFRKATKVQEVTTPR